jgi:hypothetical protein
VTLIVGHDSVTVRPDASPLRLAERGVMSPALQRYVTSYDFAHPTAGSPMTR